MDFHARSSSVLKQVESAGLWLHDDTSAEPIIILRHVKKGHSGTFSHNNYSLWIIMLHILQLSEIRSEEQAWIITTN